MHAERRHEPTVAKSRTEFETVNKKQPASSFFVQLGPIWAKVVGATSSEDVLVYSEVV